jgi:DoxX-like family
MKMKMITYRISTAFVLLVMGVSGTLAATHAPPMMEALAHLGYPPYFINLLGVAKLSGVLILLVPGFVKLKEWAYVGFAITILSACYSHFSAGDGFLALEPLLTFVALVLSYRTRPGHRPTGLNPLPHHLRENVKGARQAKTISSPDPC